ncbi:hypothetical protein [Acidovorax sp. BL-A-41-H1]|uniref:hypothetical protein n=1 Tax=Acidovorax sp. BL-A-41-H1 TaxID=3421102 RepID=UPI003F793BCB
MLPNDDPAIANRRARLREWIDTHFGGSLTLFIASTNNGEKQINQGELSALLRNKTFGERRARSLEVMAHMPPRYLEEPAKNKQTAPTQAHLARDTPKANPFADPEKAAPKPPVGWPFSKVSLARIVELKKQLGARAGVTAMQDIDETLDLVVSKWERRVAAAPAKSAA